MLTGEFDAPSRSARNRVIGGTINRTGALRVAPPHSVPTATLAQVIRSCAMHKGRALHSGLADRVSAIFVPTVLSIAIVTFIVWFVAGGDLAYRACICRRRWRYQSSHSRARWDSPAHPR